MKKILLVASKAHSLVNFRGDLIKELKNQGFEVFTLAPESNITIKDALTSLGVEHLNLTLSRKGLNPFADLKTISRIKGIIEKKQIDLVFPYTIKPVIYSSIAARKSKYPCHCISLITGLGLTFSRVNSKAKLLQIITEIMYRFALKTNKAVIFQNSDDLELFKSVRILKTTKSYVVNGSGVNPDKFPIKEYEKNKIGKVNFVFVGRLIESKGVDLILCAGQSLKNKGYNLKIHIVGSSDGGSDCINSELLQKLESSGLVQAYGTVYGVEKILKEMDVFVLPSFYREGVPRSILEALSIGLPIITTNTPGCKETVIDGQNGFLIPIKNQEELFNKMKFFLDQQDKIESFGRVSRNLVETKFDVKLINRDILRIIKENTDLYH